MASQSRRYAGQDRVHDNARPQVRGKSDYTDDLSISKQALPVYVSGSPVAAGKLLELDLEKVRQHGGVVAVVAAADIPGLNRLSAQVEDEPVFADKRIVYHGQPLFAVAASTLEIARKAAQLAVIRVEPDHPVVTIDQAVRAKSRLSEDVVLKKGRSAPAIKNAQYTISGTFSIGGQDHHYLENQTALCVPQPTGGLHVYSATQNIFQVRSAIIRSVGCRDVIVESLRVGGSFGGKLTQSNRWAIISALLALKAKKPVTVSLDKSGDTIMTGKGHEFDVGYRAGFDQQGIIKGVEITLATRCGCSDDYSSQVNDQAVLHVDNAYYLRNITVISKRCHTNTVPSTLFRGCGRSQGILVIERIIDEIAAALGLDPLRVRLNNLYGESTGQITHYGMRVETKTMLAMINEIRRTSTYLKRKKQIAQYNSASPVLKRGITLTPVKIGVSSAGLSDSAQAPALVNLEKNGQITIWTSSVEHGQGLYIKLAQVVAEVFQVDPSKITVNPPRSDVFAAFPESTGSSSLELNARAVQQASEILKQRLTDFASQEYHRPAEKIKFAAEGIKIGKKRVQFKTLVARACSRQLKLSAVGCFSAEKRTRDIISSNKYQFDDFVYGACVTEVAIDSLTGESKVIRVDLLQDCGQSVNPAIDTGQIEGGFIQGMGGMLMEETRWNSKGQIQTAGSRQYRIPLASDLPEEFHVRLYKSGKSVEHGSLNSKAVGELPLILAVSVYSAINQAVVAVKNEQGAGFPKIDVPATPERILLAIHDHAG